MIKRQLSKSKRKKFGISPYLPVVLLPLILFSGHLLKGEAFFWGAPGTQFFPWWDYAWRMIWSGQLPLWNPWVGMGAPLAANYQSALFYPPYWIDGLVFLVGGTTWMAWAHTFLVIGHLILAGAGVVKLCRTLGLESPASSVAGICYGVGGYLVARAGFFSINSAAGWFPWVLLYLYRLVIDKNWKPILKLSLTLGFLLLAGHAQTAWYIIMFGCGWVVFWSFRYSADKGVPGLKTAADRIGVYLFSGLIAAAAAAVQLLPTLQYLRQSHRSAEFGYGEAMTYSFWPWRFLTILAPDLFGNPSAGNYWGYGNYWEDALYIGVLPLVLVGILLMKTIIRSPKKNQQVEYQQLILFLGTATLVSFLFALGKNTPLFPFLYQHIPTFDMFQAPARFLIWAQLSLSLLGGLAVQQWQRPKEKGLYWTRLTAAGSGAVILTAAAAKFTLPEVEATFFFPVVLAGTWALGTALLSLTKPDPENRSKYQLWAAAVILVVSMDLLAAGWNLNPGIDKDFYGPPRKEMQLSNRVYLPPDIEYDFKFRQMFLFESFTAQQPWENLRLNQLPNLNMLNGVESVNNFDPLLPGIYQKWMIALNEMEEPEQLNAFQIMGIEQKLVSTASSGDNFQDVADGEQEQVRLYSCAAAADTPEDVLQGLQSGKWDLKKQIVFIGGDQPGESDCVQKVELLRWEKTPQAWTVVLQTEQPGWVQFSQTWYPGWRATVDQEPVEIVRSNYLFTAVAYPPGLHTIRLVYQPRVFKIGGAVSLSTLLGLIAAGVYFSRKELSGSPRE